MKKTCKNPKWGILTLFLVFMVFLSACGTKTENTNTDDAEYTETRIVSTPNGDTEVPANPSRIAVQYITGDVVELGVAPVGISDVYDGAAYAELVSESTVLGHHTSWDPEALMALEPDLILVIIEDDVEKFSEIAATVYIPYDELSMEDRVLLVGELLNKEEEAKAAVDKYNVNIEEAKNKLTQAGFDEYTISVFEGDLSDMAVMGNKYGTGAIAYGPLGLKAPERVQTDIIDKDSYRESVSFEVLAEYSGDFIIRNSYEGMDDFSENEIWNSLPAIKNNRLILMEFGLSFYTDIYSTNAQIDFLTEALINANK